LRLSLGKGQSIVSDRKFPDKEVLVFERNPNLSEDVDPEMGSKVTWKVIEDQRKKEYLPALKKLKIRVPPVQGFYARGSTD
jgi:hypothetical protein